MVSLALPGLVFPPPAPLCIRTDRHGVLGSPVCPGTCPQVPCPQVPFGETFADFPTFALVADSFGRISSPPPQETTVPLGPLQRQRLTPSTQEANGLQEQTPSHRLSHRCSLEPATLELTRDRPRRRVSIWFCCGGGDLVAAALINWHPGRPTHQNGSPSFFPEPHCLHSRVSLLSVLALVHLPSFPTYRTPPVPR